MKRDPIHFRIGLSWVQKGLLTNAILAMVKLITGIVGHSYALIADAIESFSDIISSLIAWGGLKISSRSPNAQYPYGYGKAESLTAGMIGFMLLGAALGIMIEAVREIRIPHEPPKPFTLFVLLGVIVVKEILFYKVLKASRETASSTMKADAWHHRSDSITSVAAALGISIAWWGGKGWESADEWAAIFASLIIAFNGIKILRAALGELMDEAPNSIMAEQILQVASSVEKVKAIEKLKVRPLGSGFFTEIHVQADSQLSLKEAHQLGGIVKAQIQKTMPQIREILIHMEPFENS